MKDYKKLSELQNDLKEGIIDCKTILEEYLDRIEKSLEINAFVEVFKESALKKAKDVDEKIKDGKEGKLAGLVLGIKDNICYKGHKVSASSKILEGFESLYNATAVEKLLKEDAIIIGRLNCDEFAMGGSNENSVYGPSLNPINKEKVPGGSSGGSTAAVGAKLCHAALGSDTGGSIRQPASFCGVIGLKPTYGRVSRYGLIAYGSSFDQIGPIAQSVEDAALILEVMAGADEFDSTVSTRPVDNYNLKPIQRKLKVAYISECLNNDGIDGEIKDYTLSLINNLRADGHLVEEVNFPLLDYLIPTYYLLTTAEASTNLSRFDGIRYGYRSKNATNLESTYSKSRSEGFGIEVKRRIMLGTFVLSAGYYDAYYNKALKMRRLIKDETSKILNEYDVILLPTTPTTAFKIGEKISDPITMYLEDIFTVQANLCGVPGISIPMGKHSNGMPFGIQLLNKSFKEAELLSISKYLMENYTNKN